MKKTFLLLLAAALATTVRADLTVTEKVEQDGKTETTVTKYKGEKVRLDATPDATVIFDLKTGDLVTLMHGQKAAMTMPGAAVKGMLNSAAGDVKFDPPKATGNKETISGYECTEYEMTVNGGKITMWLTEELPAAQKLAADLAALTGDGPFSALMKDQKVSGFPMKTVTEMPNMGKAIKTVVSIVKDDLPEADFKVPSGYKAVSMPAIPVP